MSSEHGEAVVQSGRRSQPKAPLRRMRTSGNSGGPGFFIVGEVVDIHSRALYSNARVDSRKKDLTDYINLRQTNGWLD